MLDVEFLMAPSLPARLIYRYRSGVLLPEVARTLARLATTQGHSPYEHLPDEFANALGGLFTGLHWSELGGAKRSVIEHAMQVMSDHQDGPTAIFVPVSSSAFKSSAWLELEQRSTVIEEPLIDFDALDKIALYALSTSDLSPPDELAADKRFRSYLRDRIGVPCDLRDILRDIDDYILTSVDRPVALSNEVAPRVAETSLTHAVRAFLRRPFPSEMHSLLHQALLRGDDVKLAVGALSAATLSLLRQQRDAAESASFGPMQEAFITWICALLTSHIKIAQMQVGYAPSWRGQPDLRAVAILELCRNYRSILQGCDRFEWLARQTKDARHLMAVMPESDERAFERLRTSALQWLKTFADVPTWCTAALLDEAVPPPAKRAMRFDADLASIAGHTLVVEHLRQRVVARALNQGVLLCGSTSGERERVASAYVKAAMCNSPVAGDACGSCTACTALASASGANDAVVRLQDARHPNDGLGSAVSPADRQVRQAREVIFQKSLWPGRRVVVLDGVDEVRQGALDRLLKAIEESRRMVSFVFMAEQLSRVPPALRSRSIVLKLKAKRLTVPDAAATSDRSPRPAVSDGRTRRGTARTEG